MKIIYFGSGRFGIKSLDALRRCRHELLCVFTQPTHKAGRGRKLHPTAVAQWAAENSMNAVEAENINAEEHIDFIKSLKPDLLVVIAFGQKISNQVIGLFPKGAINIHGSLLPKYRGAAPINWAIINGETKSGISVITLADKMDAGEILGQSDAEITADMTAEQLHDKLADISPALLLDVMEQIEAGTAIYQKQDEDKITFAPKFKKSAGCIDWHQSAGSIRNKIRGMWPWPGAQTFYACAKTSKTCRITIASAKVVKPDDSGKPTVPGVLDENMNVMCGSGCLEIIELKPAGSHLMSFKDFINGRAACPGDIFTAVEELK